LYEFPQQVEQRGLNLAKMTVNGTIPAISVVLEPIWFASRRRIDTELATDKTKHGNAA
jgi:hypothetical protein